LFFAASENQSEKGSVEKVQVFLHFKAFRYIFDDLENGALQPLVAHVKLSTKFDMKVI